MDKLFNKLEKIFCKINNLEDTLTNRIKKLEDHIETNNKNNSQEQKDNINNNQPTQHQQIHPTTLPQPISQAISTFRNENIDSDGDEDMDFDGDRYGDFDNDEDIDLDSDEDIYFDCNEFMDSDSYEANVPSNDELQPTMQLQTFNKSLDFYSDEYEDLVSDEESYFLLSIDNPQQQQQQIKRKRRNIALRINDYLVGILLSMKKTATILIKFKEHQNDDIGKTTILKHEKNIDVFIDYVHQIIIQQKEADSYKNIKKIEEMYKKYKDQNKKNNTTIQFKSLNNFIENSSHIATTQTLQSDVDKYILLKNIKRNHIKKALHYVRSPIINLKIKNSKKLIEGEIMYTPIQKFFPGTLKNPADFVNWYEDLQNVTLFLSGVFTFPIEALTDNDLLDLQVYIKFYYNQPSPIGFNLARSRNQKRRLAAYKSRK